MIIVDNSNTTGGGVFAARQNGTSKAVFGVSGAIEGNTSSDGGIFAETGGALTMPISTVIKPITRGMGFLGDVLLGTGLGAVTGLVAVGILGILASTVSKGTPYFCSMDLRLS